MKARENPYASGRVEKLTFQLEGRTWSELDERFEALGRRAALVGAHGSGKTTLAEELARRWEEEGWRIRLVRLSSENPRVSRVDWNTTLAALGGRDLVILDGSEQLSWLAWRRFSHRTRAAGGLLATSHHEGRLPTLYHCRTSAALLEGLVRELGRESALSSRPTPHLALPPVGPRQGPDRTELADLYRRHGGNLREALRELYDRSGARSDPGRRRAT